MDSEIFILYFEIYYFILLFNFFHLWPLGALSSGFCDPLTHKTSVVLLCLFVCFTLLFEHSLLFSTTSYSRLTLYIPFPTLEPTISLRNPDDFYWKMVFKTKIWEPSMLITTRVSLLQGPLS